MNKTNKKTDFNLKNNCAKKIRFKTMTVQIMVALFSLMLLSSCSNNSRISKAQKVGDRFFELLQKQEYEKAYDMLSEKAKNNISAEKFFSRYNNIRNDLKIDTVSYNQSQVVTKLDEFSYSYTTKYESSFFGEHIEKSNVTIVYEQRAYKIDWTPAQFFETMSWGDNIRIKANVAKRGDIVAGQELVATNKPGVSVYALADEVEDIEVFANSIAPLVRLDKEEILEKFSKLKRTAIVSAETINLREQPSKDAPILQSFSRNNVLEMVEKDPLPSIDENSEADFYYHVKTEEGVEGYVFSQYIYTRYVNDTLIIAQAPAEAFSATDLSIIRQIKGAQINDTDMCYFRTYPYGKAFFHVVGYVRKVTGAQLGNEKAYSEQSEKKKIELIKGVAPYNDKTKGYNENSIVGQSGIELQYESELKGVDGIEIFIADPFGTKKKTIYNQPAKSGKDIHLTIDPALQKRANDMLELYLTQDQSGTAIVTNPLTGEQLALVSFPSLDPNTFETMSKQEWERITTKDPSAPFLNRFTQGVYTPGSVFKPFTAAIAFENQKISQDTVFPYEIVDNKWTPSHIPWQYDKITRIENSGEICNLYRAMVYSDNIFFAWAALEVGKESFLEYCNRIGFYEKMEFDLPVSKSSVHKPGTDFNPKFLADSGYGQGEMQVTPLHMAALYGAFANEGSIMQPYVVESVNEPTSINDQVVLKREPKVWKQSIVAPDVVQILNKPMKDVMVYGTGKSVNSPFSLVGKTGTAERIKNDRDIAWMIAFKEENPKDYLVLVNIDTKVKEGTARNGITSSLMKYYAGILEMHKQGGFNVEN